ncbi:MAG TPA: adenylosuccinate lyase [Chitinophagaceae bacterium]|jgi:adenylosuccinate lyase|nr:adenylosuccinate lyase [Chitinophagaceae bacterium]HNA19484.1 adenylosuccinate lyase [Chitinophagaceae bacterium]HND96457.1 adenylosuccinate lyase [Chitinophagaceae bacterium]HNF45698.1 adenylosuccinate lyase [Chitinophagaceae bacterium]HNJ25752.1 adenylosuccinate lyase [Chitinophagaceae bacterium]
MELSTLTAISPVDGRYHHQVQHLNEYFSEYGLMKYRVQVEIEYLLFLEKKKFLSLPANAKKHLEKLSENFGPDEAQQIKHIEATTNHDIKAVEYFLKQELEKCGAAEAKEWIHFGLTSQDINNTAIPLSWKNAIEYDYLPELLNLKTELRLLADKWKDIPMLAHTHGQPASPTRLGKEIMVYVERLENQIEQFILIPFTGKFGGATGNFNAHHIAFPKTDWKKFSNDFLNHLGLIRQQHTTQIEHYDNLAAHFDCMKRINTIFIDFCRDVWTYVSMEYFKQKTKKGEVGSSAMPHKVNPIDFENAEGNLGFANAIFEHLAAKLPVSRLQRDLTDSTVLRNIGVPFAHTIIAFRSIEKGLNKLVVHDAKIYDDLENNWAVAAEAIQTILRREKYPNPYEALKELTRGKGSIDKKTIHRFIDNLKIKESVKKELKKISPHNYTGV